jgi:hypothetical protein
LIQKSLSILKIFSSIYAGDGNQVEAIASASLRAAEGTESGKKGW